MTKRFAGFPIVVLLVLSLLAWQTAVIAKDDPGMNGRDRGGNAGGGDRRGGSDRGPSRSGSGDRRGSASTERSRRDFGSRGTEYSLGVAKSFSEWCASRGLPGPARGGATAGPLGVNTHLEVASLEEIKRGRGGLSDFNQQCNQAIQDAAITCGLDAAACAVGGPVECALSGIECGNALANCSNACGGLGSCLGTGGP